MLKVSTYIVVECRLGEFFSSLALSQNPDGRHINREREIGLYFSYAQNIDIRIWICCRKTHQAFQKINRNYVSEVGAIDQVCSLEDMLVL